MYLLLMQHGEALSKQQDAQRPLSEGGLADVQRMANFIDNAQIHVNRIIHSGKKRAEQTATIMAHKLKRDLTIETSDLLNPNDDVDVFIKQLAHDAGTTLLVGHQPFMGKLVTYLCSENTTEAIASFVPGCVVCLEYENNKWTINWMIKPELIK